MKLLASSELPSDWDPASDKRLTVWEMTHHLLRLYHFEKAGDEATATLLQKIGSLGEVARELAYRLHNISERKNGRRRRRATTPLCLVGRKSRGLPAKCPRRLKRQRRAP